MQPVGLQEWIHKIEEGEGTKYVRLVFSILALLGITALWHLREARNFAAPEAMDAAQLARNISRGRGFTTQNIRPVSISLIESRLGKESPSVLTNPHPDLANAPVYPVLLAGLMKAFPMKWAMGSGAFWRYQPERIIGGLNQALFFLALFLTFRLSLRLFDRTVAYLAMILMALTLTFWEFVTSGLSTMLLIDLFLGLCWFLVVFEERARDEARNTALLIGLALGAGVVVGVMGLTRYSMGWLIIPVALFIAVVGTGVRTSATPAAVVAAILLMSPWLVRNFQISGRPFGTAGLAIHQGTTVFSGHLLERSMPRNLTLKLNNLELNEYPRKLFLNGETILTSELPEAAGNWISALFLGSLFVPFRNVALRRFRFFAVSCVVVFLFVQALGKTELSTDTPRYNSENLLVVLSPMFFIFGAGFFFVLLDQIEFPLPWLRSLSLTLFVVVLSLPLIVRLLPPRTFPMNYPPYSPPGIQMVSQWLKPDELLMTDMPWAAAWYGDRTSIWNTLDYGADVRDDFYRVNDEHRAVKGLYLSQLTTDAKFLSGNYQSPEGAWGKFYVKTFLLRQLPTGFPLKIGPPGLLPDQMFLSDRVRWSQR
jgi:hypothetical protein